MLHRRAWQQLCSLHNVNCHQIGIIISSATIRNGIRVAGATQLGKSVNSDSFERLSLSPLAKRNGKRIHEEM